MHVPKPIGDAYRHRRGEPVRFMKLPEVTVYEMHRDIVSGVVRLTAASAEADSRLVAAVVAQRLVFPHHSLSASPLRQ